MGKTLTGFHLKVIGVISMVFDHLLQFFSFLGVPGWFGWIGRIAAPIFLFESSEGFIHTSNRRKYMFRLLLGFWIMGILNGILNAYFSTGGLIINNIFGTLFLGTVYMQSMDYFKQKQIGKGLLWFIVPLLVSALPLVVFSSPDILSNPAILIGFQIFNLICAITNDDRRWVFICSLGRGFLFIPWQKVVTNFSNWRCCVDFSSQL